MNDVSSTPPQGLDLTEQRNVIETLEQRLDGARKDIENADTNLARLAREVEGWKRFKAYRKQVEDATAMRIRSETIELRAEEDYRSGVV